MSTKSKKMKITEKIKAKVPNENKATYETFEDLPDDLQKIIKDTNADINARGSYKSFGEYLKDVGLYDEDVNN